VQGRALIQQGHVLTGLGLLDEAMLAVVAGHMSPVTTGLLYCSVIEARREVYAFSRAREWTLALSWWCEQQSGAVTFTRTCLVHRAEILQFQGAWSKALAEACCASEYSERHHRKPPAGAPYQQAEIAFGSTNKTIAAALRLSERTIDRHVSNILNKLDIPSRTAATAYAYDHKVL
jgi:hypothetical protein